MKYLSVLLFLLCNHLSFSQISISTSLNYNNAIDWNLFFFNHREFNGNNTKIFNKSYELGLGYLYRLKRLRVDVHPSISFAKGPSDSFTYLVGGNAEELITSTTFFNINQLNFSTAIKFYPFDLDGPNKVTVMTKENKVVKQGLYFLINPSYSILNFSYRLETFENAMDADRSFRTIEPRFGIGAGFDLGISKNLTISPFVILHKMRRVTNEFFNDYFSEYCTNCPFNLLANEDATEFNQFQMGINFIFEFGKDGE